jgi:hypothetical protein
MCGRVPICVLLYSVTRRSCCNECLCDLRLVCVGNRLQSMQLGGGWLCSNSRMLHVPSQAHASNWALACVCVEHPLPLCRVRTQAIWLLTLLLPPPQFHRALATKLVPTSTASSDARPARPRDSRKSARFGFAQCDCELPRAFCTVSRSCSHACTHTVTCGVHAKHVGLLVWPVGSSSDSAGAPHHSASCSPPRRTTLS